MSKDTVETSSARPTYLHGTNEGRVAMKMNGVGQMTATGPDKGKAQIESQNLLCLAMEQDKFEGGYNAR